MIKKISGSVFTLLLSAGVSGNVQAALASDAVLDFADGIGACQAGGVYPDCDLNATTVLSGSYFALDVSGNGVIDENERIAIASAGVGVTSGSPQAQGEVDLDWQFAGNSGRHYSQGVDGLDPDGITVSSASGNTATINMTGWTIFWGDVAAGTAGPINAGIGEDATVTCAVDCAAGDSFVLDYAAILPSGPSAGFLYTLHLEGVISSVPVPAAIWLFGSGLLGLMGISRRRKVS